MADRKDALQKIADNTLYGAGVSGAMVAYSFKVFSRYLVEGNILELGPAEGLMTQELARTEMPLTVVEGAKTFCDDLARRFPEAVVHHALFEDFETDERFSNIILGHVLEHVDDPVGVLRHVKRFLAEGGQILCAVPNARSIHRQAGVLMGQLDFEEDMSPLDIHHGHKRVYTPETFRREFQAAGLEIEVFGGYWLKPLANSQIERDWTPQMVETFMKLGERYPDIAAEIYVVARHPTDA
jgi:2-polyprenyl-3-methyl-5-hydroxy-6-metoxy-1,4-benzoquinol methylase